LGLGAWPPTPLQQAEYRERSGSTRMPPPPPGARWSQLMRWGQGPRGSKQWAENLQNPKFRDALTRDLKKAGVTRRQLKRMQQQYKNLDGKIQQAGPKPGQESPLLRYQGLELLLKNYSLPADLVPMQDWEFNCTYVANCA